jgi:hypothetical protein
MTSSSGKMYVNVFNVQLISKNAVDISVLVRDLGNIPKHCICDGGPCREYLLCLDATIDVKKLCEKYNYYCYYPTVHKMEVDKDTQWLTIRPWRHDIVVAALPLKATVSPCFSMLSKTDGCSQPLRYLQ